MWRPCFGRGFGPLVRQTAKWWNDNYYILRQLYQQYIKRDKSSVTNFLPVTRESSDIIFCHLNTFIFSGSNIIFSVFNILKEFVCVCVYVWLGVGVWKCVWVCVGVCVGVCVCEWVCVDVNNDYYSEFFAAIYWSAFSILLNNSLPTVDSNIKSTQYRNISLYSNTNITHWQLNFNGNIYTMILSSHLFRI
jgi:hypothetical protein